MKKLALKVQSARVPHSFTRKDGEEYEGMWNLTFIPKERELQDSFSEKISRHMVANSLLVLLGLPPISSYLEADLLWKTDNKVYNKVVNPETDLEISFQHIFAEHSGSFKHKGSDEGRRQEWVPQQNCVRDAVPFKQD